MRRKHRRKILVVAGAVAVLAVAASVVFAHGRWRRFVGEISHFTERPSAEIRYRPVYVPYSPYQAREEWGDETSPHVAMNLAPGLPEPYPGCKSRIAIVIDDLGISAQGTLRAIALPAAVTLSFLPYGSEVSQLAARARAAGHELLLHVPMEPMGHENPGPGALFVKQTSDETRSRLEKDFASFQGYDGVNNHMGSRFTADAESMRRIMDLLHERHLFFLDSGTSGKSIGAKVAREYGVATETRDVFLDNVASLDAVKAQLAATERVARRKCNAVAIGHPHPMVFQAIEEWAAGAGERGVELVPVRELVR
jgi:uncharacterized protein